MSEIGIEERLVDVSTCELVDEIMRRCKPAIFMGYKDEEEYSKVFSTWYGDSSICYGLCHQMAFEINKDMIYNQLNSDGA